MWVEYELEGVLLLDFFIENFFNLKYGVKLVF